MSHLSQKSLSLSLILPNYNYAHYFSSRLKEVLNQTAFNSNTNPPQIILSELIVLDDASTDNSDAVIKSELKHLRKSHPGLKIIYKRNRKNSGNVFSQWQQGIKLATGDYVWIAELDDSSVLTLLETLFHPIQNHPGVVLSYSNSKLIGSVSKKDRLRQTLDFFRRRHLPGAYVIDGKRELNKNLAIYNSVPNVSACIIKNLPELSPILEEAKTYHLSGDWYFYSQLALLGDFAYTPKKLNFHRLSSNSVTSGTNLKTRFSELQKIHQELVSTAPLKNSTLRRIQRSESRLKRSWRLA